MKGTDAHCLPAAADFAETLGWKTHSPKRLVLQAGKDLQAVQKGFSVASENGDWLRQAARKNVLVDPTFVLKFEKDEGLVRAVAETQSVFELPLWPLLHASGRKRASLLSSYGRFAALCDKRGAKWVWTSQAQAAWDVKSPRETEALLIQVGLTREQAGKKIAEEPL